MSSFLSKLLCLLAPRRREYVAVDKNFIILDTSFGVRRFADSPDDVMKGQDIRLGFPELFGLEDLLIDILEGRQESYELNAIGRFPAQGEPLYFDIHIIKNPDEKLQCDSLIIFLENVTERMLLEQSLVQASNEKSLLLSALEKSKSYIDTIILSMADALIVTNSSGTIKKINNAAIKLFGYQEEELIKQQISLIIADLFFLEKTYQSLQLSRSKSKNVEVICQTKTGEKIVVAFSYSAIETEAEGLQDLIYIGRDVTERYRAQKRLAAQYATTRIMSESVSRYEATPKILEALGESLGWDIGQIWTPDPYLGVPASRQEGELVDNGLRCVETWVRPSVVLSDFIALSNQTSFAPGIGLPGRVWETRSPQWIIDVVNEPSFMLSEAALIAGLHGALGFPIQTNQEIFGVMTFLTSDIQSPDEELLQVMVGIGNQLGQFIKRKQAEAALVESEERYRDLFENASDLIQAVTPEGRFLYVNRAWRETLGYDSDAEIAQLSLLDVIHADCKTHGLQLFYRAMSGEKIDQDRVEFITKDQRKISLEGSVNCKFIQGKPVATRGIFRDITQRLLAEEALLQQQEQTERLLRNILPEAIATRLKQENRTIAEDFAEVSVLFADLVGFTQIASLFSAIELVDLLNKIFSAFDRLTEKHGLEKIKTVGDAYMVVGGLPTRRADHAEAIADMALDMQAAMAQFNAENNKNFSIRIGINTGPVVAGVIGIKKFSYDLWGDTVNIASRMEAHGLAGQIQVTAATYERLRERYLFEKRGAIQVKGKGEMITYLLMGRKPIIQGN